MIQAKHIFPLVATLASILVCGARAELPIRVPERDEPVDFQQDILPILKANCLACHNASEAEGELVLESVESIKEGGLAGPAVVEGNSDESLFFLAASHSFDIIMPPEDNTAGAENLSPEELGLVKLWIDQGARESEAVAEADIEWQPLTKDIDPIYAVAVSPHGRYVAAGWGNRLFVYEISTTRLVGELVDRSLADQFVSTTAPPAAAHLDFVQSLAVSPDGQRLASGGFRTVKIWRKDLPAANEQLYGRIDGLPPQVEDDSARSFNPQPAARNESPDQSADTKTVRWSENIVELLKPDATEVARTFDFGQTVVQAALSPDGSRVVAIGKRGPARLWNAENGEVVAELHGRINLRDRAGEADRLAGIRERQRDQAQSDLEAANKAVEEAEAQLKQAQEEVEPAEDALEEKREAEEEKLAAKTAAAEKLAAAEESGEGVEEAKKASEQATKEADAATGAREEAERNLQAAKDAVERNGPPLARAKQTAQDAEAELEAAEKAFDKAASVRNGVNDELAESAPDLRRVAFSPNGEDVAIVDAAGVLWTYAAANGSPLEEFGTGASEPLGLIYIADAQVRVLTKSGAYEQSTRARWTLERTIGSLDDPTTLVDRVTALDFSPDGKLLAAGGGEPSRSGQIKVFDVETGEVVHDIKDPHSDTVLSLAFAPDGARLASGGADRYAKVFDVPSGELVKTLEGHTSHVLSVAWHAVGRMLATASADNTIKIWDSRTAEQERTIDGFNSPVNSVAFIGTDDTCVVGSKDLVASRKTDGKGGPSYDGATDFVHAVDATPDGKLIVAGGQDGRLRVWKAEGEAVATFAPSRGSEEEQGER